jgi:hypothetical protein
MEEAIPLVVCALVCYRGICARKVIPEPVLLWWGRLNWLKVLSFSPFLASDRELSKSIGLFLSMLCHIRLPVTRAFRGENPAIAYEEVEGLLQPLQKRLVEKESFGCCLLMLANQIIVFAQVIKPRFVNLSLADVSGCCYACDEVLELRSDCTIHHNPSSRN